MVFENGVEACTETLCVMNVTNVATNALVESVRVVCEFARVLECVCDVRFVRVYTWTLHLGIVLRHCTQRTRRTRPQTRWSAYVRGMYDFACVWCL
jgi:Na+/serine symporter